MIEGSVNPLPYVGTFVKKHDPSFYENAQVSGSFNWVQAVTAGLKEPYAFAAFLGNIVDFSLPGSKESKGIGYSELLYSQGTYHVKSNTLIRDDWREMEWKVKGDRKTQDQKLSWSFRFGAKLHGNPDITDIEAFTPFSQNVAREQAGRRCPQELSAAPARGSVPALCCPGERSGPRRT